MPRVIKRLCRSPSSVTCSTTALPGYPSRDLGLRNILHSASKSTQRRREFLRSRYAYLMWAVPYLVIDLLCTNHKKESSKSGGNYDIFFNKTGLFTKPFEHC